MFLEGSARIRSLQRRLDPQVRGFYKDTLDRPPQHPASPAAMRAATDLTFNDKVHRAEIGRYVDRVISCETREIPIRIYWPKGAQEECQSHPSQRIAATRPLLLYFHGGGFVIHNIQSHDDLCRCLATAGDCIVVSVGYRLAPEHPWPACMEDGDEALRWAFENARTLGADPERVILGGDSAGATISAVVSMINRDRRRCQRDRGQIQEPAVRMQILCYGSFSSLEDEKSDSLREFGRGGFVLPKNSMDWFMKQYIPADADQSHPYLNPGRAGDLTELPPSLCITAECDPLRDDGEAFAAQLRAAGNQVIHQRIPGVMHGFLLYWYRFDVAQRVIVWMGEGIRGTVSQREESQ